MGLVNWLRSLFSPRELEPAPEFPEGWGPLSVVGESQYQAALHRWATLTPEPDNPFDGNAVVVQVDGETVGYLSRRDAGR